LAINTHMTKYTIGITTFSKRLNFLTTLVKQVRQFTSEDVIIAVNGDNKSEFNNQYRKDVLTLCLQYDNVYPIFFTEFRGLPKMWNTIAIHSKNDLLCIMNDDIEITGNNLFTWLGGTNVQTSETITILNGSFSHYIVTKQLLEKLKYFDERFLGFGHEDGDMMYRHIEMLNKDVSNVSMHGIHNITSGVRDDNVRNSFGKYSEFNHEFLVGRFGPKYKPADNPKIFTSFSPHMYKFMEDSDQYPYETFFRKNKENV